MPKKAKDPLKTKTEVAGSRLATYQAIAARLKTLNPPIRIEDHIAELDGAKRFPKPGQPIQSDEPYSSLIAHPSTLDGIDFIAVNPRDLANVYSGARDIQGETALVSMQEDPGHWALRASFGATFGTGWRQVWRQDPYVPAMVPEGPQANRMFSMRFGTPMNFTALHCAVHESTGKCNVHIDQSGFVLALPKGFALTANLYDHIANELKWKTDFRNWLAGKMPNETAAKIVREVVRRVSFVFPNIQNEFADLNRRLHNLRRPRTPGDLLWTTVKLAAPIGATFDAYENDYFKVQVHGTIADGDKSVTITVGGEW